MTSEKVTTSEEVEKGNKVLDDMKGAMVTIRMKDLYHFEGQYKWPTSWLNLDNGFWKRKFSSLEPDFYIYIFMKRILKVNISNHKKRFF